MSHNWILSNFQCLILVVHFPRYFYISTTCVRQSGQLLLREGELINVGYLYFVNYFFLYGNNNNKISHIGTIVFTMSDSGKLKRKTFKANFNKVEPHNDNGKLITFSINDLQGFDKLKLNDNHEVNLIIDKNQWGCREKYVIFCSFLSVLLAVLSIRAGIIKETFNDDIWWFLTKDNIGLIIVAFWIIAPPVVFWFEWFLSRDLDREILNNIKHNHDLSRNIWLGFTTLLIALFEIKWP